MDAVRVCETVSVAPIMQIDRQAGRPHQDGFIL